MEVRGTEGEQEVMGRCRVLRAYALMWVGYLMSRFSYLCIFPLEKIQSQLKKCSVSDLGRGGALASRSSQGAAVVQIQGALFIQELPFCILTFKIL